MNDGTMEYSIKTGASLDDLQTLKQNLNFNDKNIFTGKSEYSGVPLNDYCSDVTTTRQYIKLAEGKFSNSFKASLQFMIASENNIWNPKKDLYLITVSTRSNVINNPRITYEILRLSGKAGTLTDKLEFWYYTNDNKVIFGIYIANYDEHFELIKLSRDNLTLFYDIKNLGIDPPSENLQYAKDYEVVTTEGSTMFGSLMHDEEEWFNIYGGPKSTQSCGILQLGNESGRFNLIAKTIGDTIQSGEMCGYPDGRLTWNGNDLAGSAIIAKSLSANGYIKYASGLIIQWGTTQITSIPHTINFPIPFTTCVRPVAVYNGATSTDTDLILGWTESTLTITRGNTSNIAWHAIGF